VHWSALTQRNTPQNSFINDLEIAVTDAWHSSHINGKKKESASEEATLTFDHFV
jgi:hypothetical protein